MNQQYLKQVSLLVRILPFIAQEKDVAFHEILNPTLLDQSITMNNQFSGMTDTAFTYNTFQETRDLLIEKIHLSIQPKIREALIDIADGNASLLFQNYLPFPGVQWKILNILKLKDSNIVKHKNQVEALRQIFYNS